MTGGDQKRNRIYVSNGDSKKRSQNFLS